MFRPRPDRGVPRRGGRRAAGGDGEARGHAVRQGLLARPRPRPRPRPRREGQGQARRGQWGGRGQRTNVPTGLFNFFDVKKKMPCTWHSNDTKSSRDQLFFFFFFFFVILCWGGGGFSKQKMKSENISLKKRKERKGIKYEHEDMLFL